MSKMIKLGGYLLPLSLLRVLSNPDKAARTLKENITKNRANIISDLDKGLTQLIKLEKV